MSPSGSSHTCDPTGLPVAVCDVEPDSVHDITAARATGFLGALYAPRRLCSGCPR